MAPVAFYSRISTNQLSTNQFFRLPAYHKEYARDISCSLLVPPIVVSKRNRRQERTAVDMGDAPGPIPPALPLFSLPIDAPSRAENTKKQYTKCNAMFIAYLVDADISLFHEAYRNIFSANQHDKLHPETAVSRANLLAFARHALANGMPIRLIEVQAGQRARWIVHG